MKTITIQSGKVEVGKLSIISAIVALAVICGIAFSGTSGPSPVPNPPNFQINTQPIVLCRGQTNEIPLTIYDGGTNYPSIGISNLSGGAAMQDVELGITPTKSVTPSGTSDNYLASINPFNSVDYSIPVFVNQSAPLITTVEVSISYYYLEFYADNETRQITFETAQCPSPISVNMTPKTLTSGEIQNVSVKIRNNGNDSISDVALQLSIPAVDGAFIGTPQASTSSLAPGQSFHVNASVFVSRNASIESFPINLTATFYNSKGELEQVVNTTSIIPVGAINLLTSGLTLAPSTTTPGGIFSISFVLTDIGTSGASAASAYAILPSEFTSYGTNPVYIGDISADAQTPVTLTLETSTTAKPGTYKIPIKLTYLNALRQNKTTTMNISVNVTSSSGALSGLNGTSGAEYRSSGGGFGLAVPIILVIAVAVVGWLYYKERQKNTRHHHHDKGHQ